MTDTTPPIDLDLLRKRYDEEREKRFKVADRSDYIVANGALADRFDKDVWATDDGARAPVGARFRGGNHRWRFSPA